ncbi:MAG: RNA polymerase sigma factor [Acidimicrobiia bacterium]
MVDDGVVGRRDEELFAELYPSLRRLAAVVRPLEEDPDDLVQEALARALAIRPLSAFDDPCAYLRTAIVRLASNHRRRLGRHRRALSRAGLPADASQANYPSDLDDLRRLGVRDRAVLYLSLVEGYSYREIAGVLGCGEQAARARASRALRRLRSDLREEIRDG